MDRSVLQVGTEFELKGWTCKLDAFWGLADKFGYGYRFMYEAPHDQATYFLTIEALNIEAAVRDLANRLPRILPQVPDLEPAKERVQKIHALPGVPMSPAAILARAQEWTDDIENVFVVIRTKGDNWVVNWSNATTQEFSMGVHTLTRMFYAHLEANTDEGCFVDSPPSPDVA